MKLFANSFTCFYIAAHLSFNMFSLFGVPSSQLAVNMQLKYRFNDSVRLILTQLAIGRACHGVIVGMPLLNSLTLRHFFFYHDLS